MFWSMSTNYWLRSFGSKIFPGAPGSKLGILGHVVNDAYYWTATQLISLIGSKYVLVNEY